DRSTSDRVAAELGAKSCESVNALLALDDVRAIVIVSPARFHVAHAIAAAGAGKDVFVEKPIATTLAEADRAIAAAREAGVSLQVGFQRRYDTPYVEARNVVSSGALGRPLFYRGINRDREAPVGAPGSLATNDIITESAIHDLDGARWMMADEVAGVRASLATIGDNASTPAPNLAMVELRFARGAVAHVEAMRGARYGYDIRSEVMCETGAVFVGGFAQTMLTVMRGDERRDDLYPGFLERYADAYLAEMRDFVAAVRDRRPPAVAGEDGRAALAIALAAGRAAATSTEVALA
ncbi:MAG TPA: Gfo/Idh/MocA family oxidoreductase, partial [Methylomirabilota bacterium]|nr:Gfo/Idh/MocA family oxidoreductase [Methylomirabilota bacterium]